MEKANIAVIGLGVMGQNLVLNLERQGQSISVFNRDASKTKTFVSTRAKDKNILPYYDYPSLAASLEKPRCVLLMVSAGQAVDSVISQLIPYLEKGDILVDGGNSFFLDSARRWKELDDRGLRFIGMGVSGGEEGALWGPSLMPGGDKKAYEVLAPMLTKIAAKAHDGEPCVMYIGPRGAGHFIKMLHNGLEYADMQMIAEIYDLLSRGLGYDAFELADIFSEWNNGILESYLIEITAKILRKADSITGKPIVDVILDEAQQKGTGKWTSQNSLEIGASIPTINASVESRIISSFKELRGKVSREMVISTVKYRGNPKNVVKACHDALYASKVINYSQGMQLMEIASEEYQYNLQPGEIVRIWRAGCIIRANLLNKITDAYRRNGHLDHLLLDASLRNEMKEFQKGLRQVVKTSVELGIPVAALGASLSYFDALRSERLPANLTQAQRDFFGAHTYRRLDMEGIFHTEWT